MGSSRLAYYALILFPCWTAAQEKRGDAPGDLVSLVHHDSYMSLQGPNTKFYLLDGSTTKWIGVNTEYLTEIETTKTTNGITTTYKTGVPVAITTATAATDGLALGDTSVALPPAAVDALNKIGEEAIAACGGKRRKRQACDINTEFANRVGQQLGGGGGGGGGPLEFDIDIPWPVITAPDVAAVLANARVVVPGLSFFVLAWLLARQSHGDKPGAPKFPPAVNVPSVVVSLAPTTATPTTTASSTQVCPSEAPTGIDAPTCPDNDCKGPNEEEDDNKLICAEGKWRGCPCLREAESFGQQGDDQLYDGKTWYELQQIFLEDSANFKESPWCIPGAQPNSNKVPNSYCQCGENYASLYEKASSTTEPYNPCPYTTPPGPTLVFSTKTPEPEPEKTSPPSGQPTSEPKCDPVLGPPHDNPNNDMLVSLCGFNTKDTCWRRKQYPYCVNQGTDTSKPMKNNAYWAKFVKDEKAPEECKDIFFDHNGQEGLSQLGIDLCYPAFDAIVKACPWMGGEVKNVCGTFSLRACSYSANCGKL